jgi:hypothetical protein
MSRPGAIAADVVSSKGVLLRLVVCAVALAATTGAIPAASAATPAADLTIQVTAMPTMFSSGDAALCAVGTVSPCDAYQVTVTNSGSVPTDGGTITLTDTLPTGLGIQQLEAQEGTASGGSCKQESAAVVRCRFPYALAPDATVGVLIYVAVEAGAASGQPNTATVSGGGAAEASVSEDDIVDASPLPFGPSGFSSSIAGLDGAPDTQAGAHPYELTTDVALNSVIRETADGNVGVTSVQDLRDIVLDLPLGLGASALAAPTCTLAELSSEGGGGAASGCPPDTAVGHIRTEPMGGVGADGTLYNLVPEGGVAVELGYVDALHNPHVLYGDLAPTPSGYVLRIAGREIPQIALTGVITNLYGDPAARDSSEPAVPMFSNPADCSGEPLTTTVYLDSWQAPGSYDADGTPDLDNHNWVKAESVSPPVTGCAALAGLFEPTVETRTETSAANSPTGLQVNVTIPQSKGVETLATPPLEEATVTLPEGMTISASAANGLSACSRAQVGWLGGTLENFSASPPSCPKSSEIGTVELESPDLPSSIDGSIYLARRDENPFGSPLAIYIVIDDAHSGVLVKLAAQVRANPTTGRLTVEIGGAPQFPLASLRVRFFGGARALLTTPVACGSYTVSSVLTPWSAPESGPPASPASSFEVTEAAGGGPCASSLPFAPSFAAGTSQSRAGTFAPFSMLFARQDSEQTLREVSVTTPPGLLGSLENVAPCPEPQASTGDCPPESEIGEATVAVGAGADPYWLHGGRVYLTGPYDDGPFGLSMVVPTTAGPFTLTGNGGPGREVIRSSIRISPATAQLTVVSDPLPTILEGVPLQIRTVIVAINRPNFILNPTNCSPLAVTAAITSTDDAISTAATPFYASDCAGLKFTPELTAATTAHASYADGASLRLKLAYPGGALGNQSWLSEAKLDLPRQFSARLTTLQKACPAITFESNPAACPAESLIGQAIVHTPVLPVAPTGPVYFVSYGGAKFPEAVAVLQGDGIVLDVHGETSISKKHVTSVTFRDLPDVPFENLEVTIPSGPFSEFGPNLPARAKDSFCGRKLVVPTLFKAQDGAEIHQDTRVAVTGCHRAG